jgi:hypothetical protein
MGSEDCSSHVEVEVVISEGFVFAPDDEIN